jgi:two-component system nitrate/nitrite response regulator NarL
MGYTTGVQAVSKESEETALPVCLVLDGAEMNEIQTLEAAVQNLLDVLWESQIVLIEEESDTKQKMGFEICLKGDTFYISIVQYRQMTEIAPPRLSPRELEIARLIIKGMQNKSIAYALGLSPCTVSTYTKRIYLKLNVCSRTELVAKLLHDFAQFF